VPGFSISWNNAVTNATDPALHPAVSPVCRRDVDKLLKISVGSAAKTHCGTGLELACGGLLATMKAQQAVAIRFVGRRVTV
jgi:hypothetical protein